MRYALHFAIIELWQTATEEKKMTMITENEAMNLTDTELNTAWNKGNDSGDGWAPGEGDGRCIAAAIESADGTILRTVYEGSGGNTDRMYLAEIDGLFCIVADCNGAWAVTL
jgi:hypothetical protein